MLEVSLEHQRKFSEHGDGLCLHCPNSDHEPPGAIKHLDCAGVTVGLNLKFCLKLNLNSHKESLHPTAITLDSSALENCLVVWNIPTEK